MSYSRRNNSSRAEGDFDVLYAKGAFKNVYQGIYTEGQRQGEKCVIKRFISGSVFEQSYFASEMRIVEKSQEIVDKFNNTGRIDKKILLNQPQIWYKCDDKENLLVEPMITNFEKFNSNTGWTPAQRSNSIDVMQALSHFSYHCSDGEILFCDLQGGVYSDGFVITDPVIMSNEHGNYGPTDLGPEGISTFFSNHRCNRYCDRWWRKSRDRQPYFEVQRGSAMVLPTRRSRQPMTRQSRFQNSTIAE